MAVYAYLTSFIDPSFLMQQLGLIEFVMDGNGQMQDQRYQWINTSLQNFHALAEVSKVLLPLPPGVGFAYVA